MVRVDSVLLLSALSKHEINLGSYVNVKTKGKVNSLKRCKLGLKNMSLEQARSISSDLQNVGGGDCVKANFDDVLENKGEFLSPDNTKQKTLKRSSSRRKSTSNLSVDPKTAERLCQVTHLHLQKKNITHLDEIRLCRRTRYLFLQENLLKRISHLKHLHYIIEIYLHDNQVSRLEGLVHLKHLQKFLAPRNLLSVAENLSPNLKELELQEQKLPLGESLLLDPNALLCVKESLTLLDISYNGIKDLQAVKILYKLQILRANNNKIDNLKYLCQSITELNDLYELELRCNPVCQDRRYRIAVITASTAKLSLFDDREVTKQNRLFSAERPIKKLNPKKEVKPSRGIVGLCVYNTLKGNNSTLAASSGES